MHKTALLLACVAFAAIGCGSQPQQAPAPATPTKIVGTPQPAAPAPPAEEPKQPPAAQQPEEPEEPAEPAKQITCKLPGGWASIPSSRLPEGITAVYINPEKHGQVVVRPAPEGKTTAAQAEILHQLIAKNNQGIKLSKISSAADGKSSSFTIDAGEVHAKLVVRRLGGPDDTFAFLGKWEAKNEKALAPDVDKIINGAALQK